MIELGVPPYIRVEDGLDERCFGCPAITAREFIGGSRSGKMVCEFAFRPGVRDIDDEIGCRKGPIETGDILVLAVRPQADIQYQPLD